MVQTTVKQEGHSMSWKTGEFSSCDVARLRDTVLFSFFFKNFSFYSVQNILTSEQKRKKTSCSIFNLCFFANVLISNILHKVECVFQSDELSL